MMTFIPQRSTWLVHEYLQVAQIKRAISMIAHVFSQ